MSLIAALPGLAAISGGVMLLATFGRDPKADEHDISDYRPTLAPTRRNWPPVDQQAPATTQREHDGDFNWGYADDILPPAPPGTNAGGSPLYRATYVADMFRDFDAEAVAARYLREIAAEAVTR